MKLSIERTITAPAVNFNRKTNRQAGLNGLFPLAMTLVCMIGLCYCSIAQENSSIVSDTSHSGGTIITEDKVQHLEGADYSVFFSEASGSGTGVCAGKGSAVLSTPFSTAIFLEMGFPSGGYPTITDMVVFNGKLYLSTSKAPLDDFGTNAFHTTDGISYTKILEDPSSQGYLRMNVFDNKLWIPDGDPNGLDPSFVYTSTTGAPNSFTQTQVNQAVHTFDVIKYNNKIFCSNGMNSGLGGLCKFDGSSQWSSVYQDASSFRMKYMAQFNGKLFVANRNTSSDIDCFVWSGDAETTPPSPQNVVAGYSSTFRWFVSSQGKLFWSVLASSQARVMVTTDGVNWQTVPALNGKFVSDFAELNGNLYALASDGLWESADHFTFQLISTPPASYPDAFKTVPAGSGINPDGVASMEVYNGSLWCGSSRNGKVYKVDLGTTSVPETADASNHHTITGHSVIFHIENPSQFALRVYAIDGSLVKSISYGTVNKGSHEINLDELKRGFYLLEAFMGNEVKGIKFVKR